MNPCALFTGSESNTLWLTEFEHQFPQLNIQPWNQVVDFDAVEYGIVWQPSSAYFERFPNLKAVFNLGAGVDAILSNPTVPAHVQIIRIEDGGMAQQMNQYFSYFLLHYYRDMDLYQQQQQQQSHWQVQSVKSPNNFRVGILGLGQLGSQLAIHLQSYGFNIAGWSLSKKHLDGVATYAGDEQLGAFLQRTDALCCLLPLTPVTQDILNHHHLSQLPAGAVVINGARGGHLVAADLLQLLNNGHLRGAVLDAFEQEPLDTKHAFWQHPKILLTPHCAAQSEYDTCVQQIGHKLEAILSNQPVTGLINRHKGY
ncbi:MAG: glyoxylate/hydroxypyruvate reductase A [Gammaproteobacteria bacterium]|nr:glyoxylate/hydroxypyruvate reductase A [Gammaproteobacteria bacterium]